MKKLLLQIAFIMLMLPAMTEAAVYISGTVTDSANNNPIPNHSVTIFADSTYGFYYYNVVYTNQAGFYTDSVPAPNGTSGILYVQTLDCNNLIHEVILNYTPANQQFTADFQVCNSASPCQADFSYYISGYLAVQFTDLSTGGNGPWNWSFGDGGTSTVQNPSYVYFYPGQYVVTLAYGDANTNCYDTKSVTIYLNDSTGGGCNAAFTYIPDSVNNPPYTYQFIDQSTGNIITWLWEFGDPLSGVNNASTSQNPIHAFSAPGIYNVCLTVQGADSSCYDVTCNTVIVGNNTGCEADFTFYPDSSYINAFQFIDQSAGSIIYWSWNFGDPSSGGGNTSNAPNPAHVFTAAGIYNVCLTIMGVDSNCYDITCKAVVVGNNNGCVANFESGQDSTNSLMIHFVDLSMWNIVSWLWDFGDGTPASSVQNPTHIYPEPGTYTVCLTIHGADSTCFDILCKTVIVGNNAGCQAMYTYDYNPAYGAYAIQFTDQSTGGPVTWMWNFGDSATSTQQNPLHIYAGPGTYQACLTITGNNCTSTYCQNVIVEDSSTYHQVYGQVFEGSFPLQMGLALIFSLDSNVNYNPYIDVCNIDSMGVYYFSLVPDGNYLVYAIPLDYNGYLPTYYGDVVNWEQATVIELGEPNNPYDIHLIQSAYMPQGQGSVSGQINMGSLRSSMLDKMVMLLLDENGNPLYFGRVSESGSFDFPTLDYGTYYLHAELSGITSDNVQVVLSPEKPHSDVVMTLAGKNILGLDNKIPKLEAGVIYPNPATDQFNIAMNLKEAATVKVEIFNQTGQITSSMIRSLGSGQTVLTLSVSDLSAGFYTLRVSSENGINITRKLLIAK